MNRARVFALWVVFRAALPSFMLWCSPVASAQYEGVGAFLDEGQVLLGLYRSACEGLNDPDLFSSCVTSAAPFSPQVVGEHRTCLNTSPSGYPARNNVLFAFQLDSRDEGFEVNRYYKQQYNGFSLGCVGEAYYIKVKVAGQWLDVGRVRPSPSPQVIGVWCEGEACRTINTRIEAVCVYSGPVGANSCTTTPELTVTTWGSGSITSIPAGINCPGTCAATFPAGQTVVLTAHPAQGHRFEKWGLGGDCSGDSPSCTVNMSQSRSATANFESTGGSVSYRLRVERAGNGTVSSTPSGIACGGSCEAYFGSGTQVTLRASPTSGHRFDRWGGACTGSATTCTVSMNQARDVSAYFVSTSTTNHTLTLARNGSGTVTSSPSGINCGSACQSTFAKGTQVTLTATPAAGWRFKQWGGGCSGVSEGNICRISISQNRNATVHFEQIPGGTTSHTLNLTRYGSGTVTSSPGGINCGSTCQGTFAKGTQVRLTATPAAGWRFKQWGGGCSGVSEGNVCRISISQNRNATVYFQEEGGGTRSAALFFDSVNGSTYKPLVRNSGTAVRFAWRTQNLPAGTTCQIRRLPNHDWKKGVSPVSQGTYTDTGIHAWATGTRPFYLWCSDGTTSPEIYLDIVQNAGQIPSVKFRFDSANGPTTKSIVRNSGAPVRFAWQTSNLRQGTACQIRRLPNHDWKKGVSPISGGTYTDNNINTWAAGARQLYLWCSNGLTSPVITLNISTPVVGHALTVQKSGAGTGTITSSPSGINCGSTCSASFSSNTTVTLTATAAAITSGGSSLFTGWTGACSGTAPTCTLPMNAAKHVGAEFVNIERRARKISAGGGGFVAPGGHSCTLTTAGAVWCWGYNGNFQLGDGSSDNRLTPTPVVGFSSGVREISVGSSHTCALTNEGGVYCWGGGANGELGDGGRENRSMPVAVSGLSGGVQDIAAGSGHTCALLANGTVQCWGYNVAGQLGDNSTTTRLTPWPVQGLAGVQAISAGRHHTCALTTAGAVRCWGSNGAGQLGDGTQTNRRAPQPVVNLSSGVRAISAGMDHTCAVTTAGAVHCWGYNGYGQLGINATFPFYLTPQPVHGLTDVREVSAGGVHSCAVRYFGELFCWGGNDKGQLGDGTSTNRLVPVAIQGMGRVQEVSTGGAHTCVVRSDSWVLCFGGNQYGQLGDGTTQDNWIGTWLSGFVGRYTYTNASIYPIHDNATVDSPITISGRYGNAHWISVSLRIVHTYRGDLVVDLIAPDGTVRNYHNRAGGSEDNLDGGWLIGGDVWTGVPINGTWRLRVRDMANGDTGYIERWSINF
ncbi:proprotein convertase P-domain-containing protein [Xanthomonadaceae bacterium JHOS43]|nr:proprotein convertase P-domain-containing protein [Xanthomonadaceae bacterium JHOS43]